MATRRRPARRVVVVPRLKWQRPTSIISMLDLGERTLAFTINEVPPVMIPKGTRGRRYAVLALTGPAVPKQLGAAGKGIDRVLDHHAHENLGANFTLAGAKRAAADFARKVINGLAPEKCGCDDISKARRKKKQRSIHRGAIRRVA